MPEKPLTSRPEVTRQKPLKQQLHEAANKTIVRIAEDGFREIDSLKAQGIEALKARGVHGFEEIGESAADLVKKLFLRGLTKS